MPDTAPKAFGRYEVQEEIGRGMMGIVYRATDPALGRTVALKTISVAFSLGEAERVVYEKRFLNEARVAAALTHPGIVVVHDVGWDVATGTPWVALEFLKGRTLAEIMQSGDPMPWEQALRIAARLASALHYAHVEGVVHRDVKPTNIMVSPEDEPKIMDFGIAKVPFAQLTAAGEFFGTPSYMSPEQIAARPVDGRSDLFSLGAVLYLMLTGKRAFDGETVPAILNAVTNRHPSPPAREVPGIPADVDYLVGRALAKDPADRFADGNTFAEDIEDVLAGRPPRHRGGWQSRTGAESTLAHGAASKLPRLPETLDLSQPDTAPGRSPINTARFGTDLVSKRDFVALGVLAGLGLLVALTLPRADRAKTTTAPAAAGPVRTAPVLTSPSPSLPVAATPTPGSSPSPPARPARLALSVEHPFKSGTLRVLVDGRQEIELALESRRKLGIVGSRRGEHSAAVDIPPGGHSVRVEVKADDDFVQAGTIRGSFKSGQSRTLDAKIEGRPRRLILSWRG